MKSDDLAFWYWLLGVKGVGPAIFRQLLDLFETPQNVFESCSESSAESDSLPSTILTAVRKARESLPKYRSFAEKQIQMASQTGAAILTLTDHQYPDFLRRQVKYAPPILHYKGNLSLTRSQSVAIVGTRAPTDEARQRSESLASKLSATSHTVIAGMAKGIDTSAHRGALKSGGATIGVLGCGLDRIYPPENAVLYQLMGEQALLISEFPFGAAPTPENLRKRNKLIVALSEAVVVAECPLNSGALIAARAALEQHRPLFVFSWADWNKESRSGIKRLLDTRLARTASEDGVTALFNVEPRQSNDVSVERMWEEAFPRARRPATSSKAKKTSSKQTKSASGKKGTSQTKQLRLEAPKIAAQPPDTISDALFRAGDRVQHPAHGSGEVTEVSNGPSGIMIKVRFARKGIILTIPAEQAKERLLPMRR